MNEDDIWAFADQAVDESKIDEPIKTSDCQHINTDFECSTADVICSDCGVVVEKKIYNGPEWNNYKDECGNYSKIRNDLTCIPIQIHIKQNKHV